MQMGLEKNSRSVELLERVNLSREDEDPEMKPMTKPSSKR